MDAEPRDPGRLHRLRWRRRGAWQWPTFTVALLADAALAHWLPAVGDGSGVLGGVLLAGFANLAVLGVIAPLGGALLRRRRGDLPAVVARDYAGTTALLVLAGGLLALGLAHRPSVRAHQAAVRAQARAVRDYVQTQAPQVYRRHLDRADSLRLDDNLFRSCVPGPDPARALCLFVDTTQLPPGVRRDPNPIPNSRYFPRGSAGGPGG